MPVLTRCRARYAVPDWCRVDDQTSSAPSSESPSPAMARPQSVRAHGQRAADPGRACHGAGQEGTIEDRTRRQLSTSCAICDSSASTVS